MSNYILFQGKTFINFDQDDLNKIFQTTDHCCGTKKNKNPIMIELDIELFKTLK